LPALLLSGVVPLVAPAEAVAQEGPAPTPAARRAARARRPVKQANLPDRWVWPPSPEMKAAGERCLQDLTRLGITWRAPERVVRKVATPVIIDSMQLGQVKLTPISRKPPFVMDCHLAVALTEQSALFAEAGIAELRFAAIHDYRRVRLRGRTLRALSRHALGLAVDVYEMTDTAGRIFKVRPHYRRVAFMRAVEKRLRESGAFRALLTPGNDRSHYDHFHFEARMRPAADETTPVSAPFGTPPPAAPPAPALVPAAPPVAPTGS
jgi:hypothetical protein